MSTARANTIPKNSSPVEQMKSLYHEATENKKVVSFVGKIKEITTLFENVIWEFVQQSAKLMKNTFKAVAQHSPKCAARLATAIKTVGILAGVNILLTLKSLPDVLKNVIKNCELGDLEGALFSTMDLLATLGGMLDDTIAFTETLSYLGLIPAIAFFGTIGLPLAIGLLTYGVVSKTYFLVRQAEFVYHLPSEITAENAEEFKKFLAEKLDDPMDRLKARKINVLSRHTDPKVVNIMKNLQTHLNEQRDLETANLALKDIKTLMRRKMALGGTSILMNGAMLTSIVAAAIFPPAAVAVPVISATKAVTSIGSHAYKTFRFTKGLNVPEFMAAPAA